VVRRRIEGTVIAEELAAGEAAPRLANPILQDKALY
jgi:hypothetical protein